MRLVVSGVPRRRLCWVHWSTQPLVQQRNGAGQYRSEDSAEEENKKEDEEEDEMEVEEEEDETWVRRGYVGSASPT